MKSLQNPRYLLLALFLVLTASILMAQDEEDKRKTEKAIQEEMTKAMQAEELQARKHMLEEQQQKMKEMERQYNDQATDLERQARDLYIVSEYSRPRVAVRSSGDETDVEYLSGSYSQGNQSQLTLRKSFRETTSTSKGEFDVETGIHNFRCMITGSVRSGEIFVGIEYPDGKIFKELVINPSADINFSQSISIKAGEEKKYIGSWIYVIKADKAEGNYMVQIMTN